MTNKLSNHSRQRLIGEHYTLERYSCIEHPRQEQRAGSYGFLTCRLLLSNPPRLDRRLLHPPRPACPVDRAIVMASGGPGQTAGGWLANTTPQFASKPGRRAGRVKSDLSSLHSTGGASPRPAEYAPGLHLCATGKLRCRLTGPSSMAQSYRKAGQVATCRSPTWL